MKNLFLDYAKSFIGVPYKWGGNSPLTGWDCSGYVLECLKAFGFIGRGDYCTKDIYTLLLQHASSSCRDTGAILFFGKNTEELTHCAIALNEQLMIEAGGGDRKVQTLEDAKTHNAFVRIRPIDSRRDLASAIMLPYGEGQL